MARTAPCISTIAADKWLPGDRLQEMILNGEVTQLHRGDKHASTGDTFDIEGTAFEDVKVETDRLGDLTVVDEFAVPLV